LHGLNSHLWLQKQLLEYFDRILVIFMPITANYWNKVSLNNECLKSPCFKEERKSSLLQIIATLLNCFAQIYNLLN
jgi:hypothetical protein